ncbi:MAG: hypothetical protein Q9162_000564 [Coniocarpon cinnabarinum]
MSNKTRDQASSKAHGVPSDPDESTSEEELETMRVDVLRTGISYGTHPLLNDVARSNETLEELATNSFLKEIGEDAQQVAMERKNAKEDFRKWKLKPSFETYRTIRKAEMRTHLMTYYKPANLDEWRQSFNANRPRFDERLQKAGEEARANKNGSSSARAKAAAHLHVAGRQTSKFHITAMEYLRDLVQAEIKRQHDKQFENTGSSRTEALKEGYFRRHPERRDHPGEPFQ